MTDDEREAMVRARELPWTDCAWLLRRLDAERTHATALEAGLRQLSRAVEAICIPAFFGVTTWQLHLKDAMDAARRLLREGA